MHHISNADNVNSIHLYSPHNMVAQANKTATGKNATKKKENIHSFTLQI